MKRTPLTRKPFVRKQTRLKNASTKRRKRNAEVRDFRQAFVTELSRCEYCGLPKSPNELAPHEIASGTADRKKALDKRFAILAVCQLKCHDRVQNERKLTQLARLWISRPNDLDVAAFNALRGRGPLAITVAEVMSEVDSILGQR
jgi:hypothetical protein